MAVAPHLAATSGVALWVRRVAWWLTALNELQLKEIHAHPRIFCDETRMPVLEKGRKTG
jgi:transposase